jgi:phosphatidylglycerophosphatase C
MTDALAAFDFDGTLTTRDCMLPFLCRLAGTRAVVTAFGRHAGTAVRRDRDGVKAGILGLLLAGRESSSVDELGERYAVDILRMRMRRDVVERLRWHQGEGHRTVIVSASLRPYLAPVARELGIDHVICTELETVDGTLTGRIDGTNCRGPVKAERLGAWWSRPDPAGTLWAYGDSSGDDHLLALADHPLRVGRRRLATQPGASVR